MGAAGGTDGGGRAAGGRRKGRHGSAKVTPGEGSGEGKASGRAVGVEDWEGRGADKFDGVFGGKGTAEDETRLISTLPRDPSAPVPLAGS